MKKKLCLILSVVLISSCVLSSCNQEKPVDSVVTPPVSEVAPTAGETIDEVDQAPIETAVDPAIFDQTVTAFMSNLIDNKFSECYSMFDESFKANITEEMLETEWHSILSEVGAFEQDGRTSIKNDGNGYVIYDITKDYESEGVITRLVFSETSPNIIALYFSYTSKTVQSDAKDLPAGVSEKNLIVGKGSAVELNAKLTYPSKADGKIPAIVLVHSAGPNGMDQTVYANKFFKNIAYELAQKGIAVLRYDKRTYAYPDTMITNIDDEVTNDAVVAKQTLLDQTDIDISGVYVVGHDLGAMLAPRILDKGNYDGMILLAGSPRSIIEIVYSQYVAFVSESEDGTPEEKVETLAQLAKEYEDSQGLLTLTDEELQNTAYLNIPAQYLKSMMADPISNYLENLTKPALILQGGKDIQTSSEKDYLAFKPFADKNKNIEMKFYENLNNLFMVSTMTPPSAEEYTTESAVDDSFLNDIAQWLKAN